MVAVKIGPRFAKLAFQQQIFDCDALFGDLCELLDYLGIDFASRPSVAMVAGSIGDLAYYGDGDRVQYGNGHFAVGGRDWENGSGFGEKANRPNRDHSFDADC